MHIRSYDMMSLKRRGFYVLFNVLRDLKIYVRFTIFLMSFIFKHLEINDTGTNFSGER